MPIIFLAIVAFIAAVMFLEGYFHEERNTRFRRIIDLDKIIFPKLDNKQLIDSADLLAFFICLIGSVVILLMAILLLLGIRLIDEPINNSAALLGASLIGSWTIRYIFIYIYKNKSADKIPKFWPFKRRYN